MAPAPTCVSFQTVAPAHGFSANTGAKVAHPFAKAQFPAAFTHVAPALVIPAVAPAHALAYDWVPVLAFVQTLALVPTMLPELGLIWLPLLPFDLWLLLGILPLLHLWVL